MKRIVVTGATSMIAVACIESCLKRNIEVLALVRPGTKRINRLPKANGLEVAECNIDMMDRFQTRKKVYDTFFHFAWADTSHEKRIDPSSQQRNIQYALDAVKLAKQLGCTKFVGAGSQAEYGPSDHILGPDSSVHPIMAYGVAKYAAGALCALECKQNDMCFNWARIFSVYGPLDNDETLLNLLLGRLLKGEVMELTKCEQTWDYLYSRDAGEALYLIGEKGKNQAVYCVGSGLERTLKEYLYWVGKAFGVNLEEQMGKRPYAPNQVMRLCADIGPLMQDTGFAPQVSFEQGIAETIEWKRKEMI